MEFYGKSSHEVKLGLQYQRSSREDTYGSFSDWYLLYTRLFTNGTHFKTWLLNMLLTFITLLENVIMIRRFGQCL